MNSAVLQQLMETHAPAVACFYTATYRRLRGAIWSIFAPALRQLVAIPAIHYKKTTAGGNRL